MALALGYVVPTVGIASGPVTRVAAITVAQPEPAPVLIPKRPAFLQPDQARRTEVESIAFSIRQVLDGSLPSGTTVVDVVGAPGTRTVRYRDALEDGALVDSIPLQVDIVPAVDRVIRLGTHVDPPPPPQPIPADPTHNFVTAIAGSATAYCLTGTTATGTQAGPGAIAVDPTVIKLGSHLYVPGYGYGWAVDTGSAIKGTLVDVWLTCDAAIQWGRRPVTIYVLAS